MFKHKSTLSDIKREVRNINLDLNKLGFSDFANLEKEKFSGQSAIENNFNEIDNREKQISDQEKRLKDALRKLEEDRLELEQKQIVFNVELNNVKDFRRIELLEELEKKTNKLKYERLKLEQLKEKIYNWENLKINDQNKLLERNLQIKSQISSLEEEIEKLNNNYNKLTRRNISLELKNNALNDSISTKQKELDFLIEQIVQRDTELRVLRRKVLIERKNLLASEEKIVNDSKILRIEKDDLINQEDIIKKNIDRLTKKEKKKIEEYRDKIKHDLLIEAKKLKIKSTKLDKKEIDLLVRENSLKNIGEPTCVNLSTKRNLNKKKDLLSEKNDLVSDSSKDSAQDKPIKKSNYDLVEKKLEEKCNETFGKDNTNKVDFGKDSESFSHKISSDGNNYSRELFEGERLNHMEGKVNEKSGVKNNADEVLFSEKKLIELEKKLVDRMDKIKNLEKSVEIKLSELSNKSKEHSRLDYERNLKEKNSEKVENPIRIKKKLSSISDEIPEFSSVKFSDIVETRRKRVENEEKLLRKKMFQFNEKEKLLKNQEKSLQEFREKLNFKNLEADDKLNKIKELEKSIDAKIAKVSRIAKDNEKLLSERDFLDSKIKNLEETKKKIDKVASKTDVITKKKERNILKSIAFFEKKKNDAKDELKFDEMILDLQENILNRDYLKAKKIYGRIYKLYNKSSTYLKNRYHSTLVKLHMQILLGNSDKSL